MSLKYKTLTTATKSNMQANRSAEFKGLINRFQNLNASRFKHKLVKLLLKSTAMGTQKLVLYSSKQHWDNFLQLFIRFVRRHISVCNKKINIFITAMGDKSITDICQCCIDSLSLSRCNKKIIKLGYTDTIQNEN